MTSQPALLLASASPRRRELLTQLGVHYDCEPADIDETLRASELPTDYVLRMAKSKAARVAERHNLHQCNVLAADTTVVIDGDVLGKPSDLMDGLAILARLSGRTHTVMTGICLHTSAEVITQVVQTDVQFVQLNREMCESYLATDEPWDKAGSYAIQGLGGAFVRAIHGSYSNVVGLPLAETWQLLSSHGIATGLEIDGE